MARDILTLSSEHNPNYLATIQRIGELRPIENSDRFLRAVVNGFDVITRNTIKCGDIVVYVPVETVICSEYLSANNCYDINWYKKNANASEVKALLAKGDGESAISAKLKAGFFDRYGRIGIIRFKGVFSCGFVAPVSSLETYDPSLTGTDWEQFIGTSFDEVNGKRFCWKFIPEARKTRGEDKPLFDKIIPETFSFHYSTLTLNNNIQSFSPNDIITISVKINGASGIFANIPIKQKTNEGENEITAYGNIYSSRSNIRNRFDKPVTYSYYGIDIWEAVNKIISPFLEKGMTVYGEIVGYVAGSRNMIQERYDYGCKPGEWKFMPYRITTLNQDNSKTEWNLLEVDGWARQLVAKHPEIGENIMFLTILYHGKFGDLYPEIPQDEHWQENVLGALKNDRKNFLMEEPEPMCGPYENEIPPREGIVIRKDDDPVPEAWKLKTKAYFVKRDEQHAAGLADIEETA